jgi:hypothetical protein
MDWLLDETVVEASVLVVTVRDDLDVLNGSSDGEDLGEHVLWSITARAREETRRLRVSGWRKATWAWAAQRKGKEDEPVTRAERFPT